MNTVYACVSAQDNLVGCVWILVKLSRLTVLETGEIQLTFVGEWVNNFRMLIWHPCRSQW